MMQWPTNDGGNLHYWMKVFIWYALAEAGVQLILYFILNYFGSQPISNLAFHSSMWVAQCMLILPVWFVAFTIGRLAVGWQLLIHLAFFIIYSIFWFGPVQQAILLVYEPLQQWLLPPGKHLTARVDSLDNIDFVPYQVLKYAFRLGWFYLAWFHFSFQKEEAGKLALAIANQALQFNLLKWQLNATFYEKTLGYLQNLASQQVKACARPLLQLSKIMEYVIYDAQAKTIPLTREAAFLVNYTDLMNQQAGTSVQWKFEQHEVCEQATIPPLLLAEIMENIDALIPKAMGGHTCLHLSCTCGHICFKATHLYFGLHKVGAILTIAIASRLQKMYAEKYKVDQHMEEGYLQVSFPMQAVEERMHFPQTSNGNNMTHAIFNTIY